MSCQPRIHVSSPTAPAALRINLIGKSNGVGLQRDLGLLAAALQTLGHDVQVLAVNAEEARRRRSLLRQSAVGLQRLYGRMGGVSPHADADINLMLEHVWPRYLRQARYNVVLPNPEWFDRHDQRFLPCVDRVWAKTQYTLQLFAERGCYSSFVGFDSEDRHQPEVPRERRFFHLAGKSTMKGTDRLLRLWAQHPHWPTLTVIQHAAHLHAPEVVAPNIDRRCGYLDDAQLRREQNACLFHLCPSLTEGWGHYLVEGLSVGAVVVSVDAAPMNELVGAGRGVLVAHESTGKQRLARTYHFSEWALRDTIEAMLRWDDARVSRVSQAARQWFLDNRAGFPARLQAALADLTVQRAAG
jgi:glycosyltransferase involved in cell wall biosynthesis